LLAAIHDVSPRFENEVDQLVDCFADHLQSYRFAMLVVPDYWGEAPLADHPNYQRKLRAWAELGVEIFVHGWYHRDHEMHDGAARFKAGLMTAGEGEFLGLSHTESVRRMRDGRMLIEDITGHPVAGFIAPAWLYSLGAHEALGKCGFSLAEDHWRVWNPQNGMTLTRGPVVTWASRSRTRRISSYAVAGLARVGMHQQAVVRIAAHPGDTHVPRIMDSIDATLGSFARRRSAGRYADLLEEVV
jgi:hypothetical protein